MPFPPVLASSIAALTQSKEELERLGSIHYQDAGHGYDAFGMHPSFVAMGGGIVRPLYDKYFRVLSTGHEHIPEVGPGVIAANHSGSLPIDGMFPPAIRPRPAHAMQPPCC